MENLSDHCNVTLVDAAVWPLKNIGKGVFNGFSFGILVIGAGKGTD